MPLNLFKRSKKKKEETIDKGLGSQAQQKKLFDAAMEFLKIFQGKMPLLGGRPHAGTVISIAARLAGTSLYKSLNKKDHASGVILLSEEVNKAYPQLLNLFALYCKKNGIDVMAKPVVTEFPVKDKLLMGLTQIQTEYQDQYDEIMKKHGLDYLEGAQAGMILCSIVFNYHCITNKDIDPYVATGIVAMGVVEGAKTSPSRDTPVNAARFVVGELELGAVLQDVKEKGGQYTQLNPMVEEKQKEGNIDPKIVYIKGLESQLEAKVSRVDFVQMNLDEILLQEQNDQMPIPVTLAHWLNDKAEEYGYKRDANSWVLKK